MYLPFALGGAWEEAVWVITDHNLQNRTLECVWFTTSSCLIPWLLFLFLRILCFYLEQLLETFFVNWRVYFYIGVPQCIIVKEYPNWHTYKNRFFMVDGKHDADLTACGFSFKRIIWLQIFQIKKKSLFATYSSKRICRLPEALLWPGRYIKNISLCRKFSILLWILKVWKAIDTVVCVWRSGLEWGTEGWGWDGFRKQSSINSVRCEVTGLFRTLYIEPLLLGFFFRK